MKKDKKDPFVQKMEKLKAAQARKLAKIKAKLNDPIEQEKRREKAIAASKRAVAKQIEKQNDPAYIEAKKEKAAAARKKQVERLKTKAPSKPKARSKGLLGRAPTASEKRIIELMATLPCLACLNKGRHQPMIQIHHINGRTKPNAHKMVIPLCAYHHESPAPAEIIERYPDLHTVHARGIVGGKVKFEKHNGTEMDLLKQAYSMLDIQPDFELI